MKLEQTGRRQALSWRWDVAGDVPPRLSEVMDTTEQKLVEELSLHVITQLRDHKVGLYEAMRVLGYVQVAVAESVDLNK